MSRVHPSYLDFQLVVTHEMLVKWSLAVLVNPSTSHVLLFFNIKNNVNYEAPYSMCVKYRHHNKIERANVSQWYKEENNLQYGSF